MTFARSRAPGLTSGGGSSNRSRCAPLHGFTIVTSLGERFPWGAGQAGIQERPQIEKAGDRQSRNVNDLDRCRRRIDHPGWNQARRLIADTKGQMATAVVKLIGDDDRGTPVQRMEGIGDLHLLAQKPGIMRLRRLRLTRPISAVRNATSTSRKAESGPGCGWQDRRCGRLGPGDGPCGRPGG